jgi:hypothetical protein
MFEKPCITSLCGALCGMLLLIGGARSDYVEGIDTTDVNGWARDSLFLINNSGVASGAFPIRGYYCETGYCTSFDDINLAPNFNDTNVTKTFTFPWKLQISYYDGSFVVRRPDSTFEKIHFLQQLTGVRAVYQFGRNTVPNDRILAKPGYDRKLLYKPNNLSMKAVTSYLPTLGSCCDSEWIQTGANFSWDPPLDNDNHLLGYIVCIAKGAIDTSKPIYPSQCYTGSLITSTSSDTGFNYNPNMAQMYNVVAVYQEGLSDLRRGWGQASVTVSILHQIQDRKSFVSNPVNVRGHNLVCCGLGSVARSTVTIFSCKGVEFAEFKMKSGSIVSLDHLPTGLYILRAELPDKTVLNQTFMFTR